MRCTPYSGMRGEQDDERDYIKWKVYGFGILSTGVSI